MEKLIKLLNEYNIELHWVDRTYKDGFDLWYEQEYMRDFRVAYLISKSFWFIKRLVDNDKININEGWDDYEKTNLYCNADFFQLQKHYSYYESLLMLLAISDNPIYLLCERLK